MKWYILFFHDIIIIYKLIKKGSLISLYFILELANDLLANCGCKRWPACLTPPLCTLLFREPNTNLWLVLVSGEHKKFSFWCYFSGCSLLTLSTVCLKQTLLRIRSPLINPRLNLIWIFVRNFRFFGDNHKLSLQQQRQYLLYAELEFIRFHQQGNIFRKQ